MWETMEMTVLGIVLTVVLGAMAVSIPVTALMLALLHGGKQKGLQSGKATENGCLSPDEKRDQGHGDLT